MWHRGQSNSGWEEFGGYASKALCWWFLSSFFTKPWCDNVGTPDIILTWPMGLPVPPWVQQGSDPRPWLHKSPGLWVHWPQLGAQQAGTNKKLYCVVGGKYRHWVLGDGGRWLIVVEHSRDRLVPDYHPGQQQNAPTQPLSHHGITTKWVLMWGHYQVV